MIHLKLGNFLRLTLLRHLGRHASSNAIRGVRPALFLSASAHRAAHGARAATRERLRETFGGFDFVSREEFDAVKALAAAALAAKLNG